MFVTEMMALTGNRRKTVSWTSIGIVVLSLLSPLPSVYGRVLPRNGDYGVVYQKVPKDMTDALNSYLDLVVLKFNSEATQRGLEPYVSTVSFPEPGFLRGVFIHGLGQWRRVGDVQVLRQWNTGRMFDVHVQTTVVMEIPKFDEHHHHHHPHREDEPADGERAVVEGDHDHDHHHAHVLDINNEAPIGEPQATVTRTLDAVFRVHEMFRRSQGDKSQGNTFRTESLFVQPEDDAVVKLSDTVTQRAGSYDKLVSQFAEFEMGRILRNPYMRKSLIRAMDNVLQTSGLRMGGLGEGARGSGTDAVFPVITDGVNLTPGPQTEIQKYPAEEMAASDADVPQPFEVAPDPDSTGPANDSQLEVLSDSTDRVLEEGEENIAEEASKEESQLDAMDSTSADEVTDPAVVDDSQKAVEEVSEPDILMDDVPPVPVEDTPTAKRRRILFV